MSAEVKPRVRTILVVDDEEMVRVSTGRMLERRGFAVILAVDGRDALDVLRRGVAVDLLLTDIVMPEIYGTDLVRLARELRPGLPALLMSGFADQRNRRHDAIPEGVPFLAKPFALGELLAKVRAAMEAAS
jgi:DNA-binding NtrC family response regulator